MQGTDIPHKIAIPKGTVFKDDKGNELIFPQYKELWVVTHRRDDTYECQLEFSVNVDFRFAKKDFDVEPSEQADTNIEASSK